MYIIACYILPMTVIYSHPQGRENYTEVNTMWKTGCIGVPDRKEKGKYTACHFEVKVYKKGGQYGINGGKIIKLCIRIDDKVVCHYDRGWDVKATGYEARFALQILLHEYN